jgi:5-methyltetrahydropteroyltriglutamate--homocysteine methyltransferase
MEVEKLVYGLYPKTNELRLHIGRWEKGRLPDAALNENMESEKKGFYNLLNEHAIDHTDPLFNWYDILRPISLIVDGIDLGPLTRFKETNSFYRMPLINGITGISIDPKDFSPLNENPPLPLYLDSGKYFNAFLPSPLSFFKMSRSTVNYEDFQSKIEGIYSRILREFKVKNLVLYDPMPYEKTDVLDLSLLDEFRIKLVTTGKLYEGNVKGNPYSIICDYNAENFRISAKNSKIPGVKLVDAYNTKMESVETINKAIGSLDADKIIVSHSEYFDFLPRIIADRKLELISEIGE